MLGRSAMGGELAMRALGLFNFCRHHVAHGAHSPDPTEDAAPPVGSVASRRDFLLGGAQAMGGAAAVAAVGSLAPDQALAQASVTAPRIEPSPAAAETPIGPKWWPSRWGADDEAGASNWITPEKVLAATRLIRTGRIYEMGRVAEQHMPVFGERGFLLRMVGSPTGGPFGDNKIVWNDEFLATEIGQVGSCLDGLGHIGCQTGSDGDAAAMRFYNGFTLKDMAAPYGLKKLGIEKVKPFFTQGLLLDIAAVAGRPLIKGEEITLSQVRQALGRQGIDEETLRPGDAVFFNTGWGALWSEPARYNDGEPGIGLEVARWLVEKEACLTGCDNWGCEAVPSANGKLAFPVHHELITRNGIFIFEGLNFQPLLDDKAWRFAFILTPLQIEGATGSIARPIAVV
jgi:kynurenine formamidase